MGIRRANGNAFLNLQTGKGYAQLDDELLEEKLLERITRVVNENETDSERQHNKLKKYLEQGLITAKEDFFTRH
jgi:hypothetical protein